MRSIFAALLLAASLCAQAPVVAPAVFQTLATNSWMDLAGQAGVINGQYGYVYDNVPAGTYNQISFRTNYSNQQQGVVRQGFQITMEAALWSRPTPASSLVVWDCRPQTGAVVVYPMNTLTTANPIVNALTTRAAANQPEPFGVITLPFSAPFVHPGGSLHLTLDVFDSTPLGPLFGFLRLDCAREIYPLGTPIGPEDPFRATPSPVSEHTIHCDTGTAWFGYLAQMRFRHDFNVQETQFIRTGPGPGIGELDAGLFGFEHATPITVPYTWDLGINYCNGTVYSDGSIWAPALGSITAITAPYTVSAVGTRFTAQAIRFDSAMNVKRISTHNFCGYHFADVPQGLFTFNGTDNRQTYGGIVNGAIRAALVIELQ